jgi:hypothetical protein
VKVPLIPHTDNDGDKHESGLSKLFLSTNKSTFVSPMSTAPYDHQSITGKIQLTIFLPDCTSMIVMANIHSSFDELIRKILYDHNEQGLKPPLYYHAPEFYELRMHDVDGEPDLDLPALDRKKTMKDMMFDTEYCLAEIDEHAPPPALIESSFDKDTKLLSSRAVSTNTVVVHFPQGDQIRLAIDEFTTLRDILPVIAKQKKLRLYTDEFVFYIYSPEEQARLKLMSPVVDPTVTIISLGTREFQLQKRVYADSVKVAKPSSNQPRHHHRHTPRMQEGQMFASVSSVYQEWNVVKRNTYGFRQERILGIDGSGVYNLRRDTGGAHDAAGHRRDISSIRSIEPVEYDRNALKIAWEEESREVVEIEYMCESEKDCAEIIAKISFLISTVRR